MYLGCWVYIYDSIHKCIFNAHTNMLQYIYKLKKKKFTYIFGTQIFLVLNMCNKKSQTYKSSVVCNFHQKHIWKALHNHLPVRIDNFVRAILFCHERAHVYFQVVFSNTWSAIDAGTSAVVVAPKNCVVCSRVQTAALWVGSDSWSGSTFSPLVA